MAKLTITIDAEGTPKIDVTGARGKVCDALTADIELALAGTGGSVTKEHKPEHNMPAGGKTDQTVKQTRW